MRDPESLAKEKYLSTVCDVVEISSKHWETNMRDPESLAKEKYLSTVCDVVEISSKALKETIVSVLEFCLRRQVWEAGDSSKSFIQS